jgi:hypothetical protein
LTSLLATLMFSSGSVRRMRRVLIVSRDAFKAVSSKLGVDDSGVLLGLCESEDVSWLCKAIGRADSEGNGEGEGGCIRSGCMPVSRPRTRRKLSSGLTDGDFGTVCSC